MDNPIILITGANAGIGKETVRQLAGDGARIYMACRRPQAGEEAAAEIRRDIPQADLEVIELDLASQQSVQEAARQLKYTVPKIDTLINNAGVFTSTWQTTEEGFELQFGVNHLGHFLLTHELLPLLQKSDYPKVINVSSAAYLQGKMDFDTLQDKPSSYKGLMAYARSKLANVLFTRELVRRYPWIHSYALHPGAVGTAFAEKDSSWIVRTIWKIAKRFFLVSPEQGAQTSVYLARTYPVPAENGSFIDDKQQARSPNALATDDQLAKKLWDYSLFACNLESKPE